MMQSGGTSAATSDLFSVFIFFGVTVVLTIVVTVAVGLWWAKRPRAPFKDPPTYWLKIDLPDREPLVYMIPDAPSLEWLVKNAKSIAETRVGSGFTSVSVSQVPP